MIEAVSIPKSPYSTSCLARLEFYSRNQNDWRVVATMLTRPTRNATANVQIRRMRIGRDRLIPDIFSFFSWDASGISVIARRQRGSCFIEANSTASAVHWRAIGVRSVLAGHWLPKRASPRTSVAEKRDKKFLCDWHRYRRKSDCVHTSISGEFIESLYSDTLHSDDSRAYRRGYRVSKIIAFHLSYRRSKLVWNYR